MEVVSARRTRSTTAQHRPNDLIPGAEMGPESFDPSLTRLVMYAAAMWEFQRIHFDPEWARTEGLEGPIVHGPLLGTYLEQAVVRWMGDDATLRELEWRNRATAAADVGLAVRGTVTAVTRDGDGNWLCHCALVMDAADGTRVLTGRAVWQLADESSATEHHSSS